MNINACNSIEMSAMRFAKGVADEELAFMPLNAVFCDFVESNYPIYCGMPATPELPRWDYTVELYRRWSLRRKGKLLEAQHDVDV